jgi:hypothetical protein
MPEFNGNWGESEKSKIKFVILRLPAEKWRFG